MINSNSNESKRVYLDNAATTPLDDRVVDVMSDTLRNVYGNPSATHSLGRKARGIVESARKNIAKLIGSDSREIIFTSGGTEADNIAIRCAVNDLGVKHIITSPLEHKAVLTTSEELENKGLAEIHLVKVDEFGHIDYDHLESLAKDFPNSIISIMHANNEVGTLCDLHRISKIAKKYNCLFHSDTVQTMGHYAIRVDEFDVDFLTCSAHKLNGPKGIGFLYVNKKHHLRPMITGGGQERSLRAGTENVAGIVGLEKSLTLAFDELEEDHPRIQSLKTLMAELLLDSIPGIEFNGDITPEGSLYTVLSCSLPPTDKNAMLLFQLDIAGVCASGGSACNSGAKTGSHVLTALGRPSDRQAIRFSFGRFNTEDDIRHAVSRLKVILEPETQTV